MAEGNGKEAAPAGIAALILKHAKGSDAMPEEGPEEEAGDISPGMLDAASQIGEALKTDDSQALASGLRDFIKRVMAED